MNISSAFGLRPALALFIAWGALSLPLTTLAGAPPCLDRGMELRLDNERALEMKQTAPLGNKYLRAYVGGRVTRIFADKKNKEGTVHAHIEIQIGDDEDEVIEIVYNEDFGDLPTPSIGAQMEACGDFINSYAPNGGYEASPSKALIHWVHRSKSKHDHGFVLLDGVLYGNGRDRLEGRYRRH